MFHAKIFSENEAYREKEFTTCPEDRPLIVQFCGNNPDTVLAAAKHVEDRCDAVDLNLGCPQGIAKKGFYGSYLQDEWELVASIVRKLHENLKVPVTCKIRIFPDVEKTIRYAKMLEANGCQLLTVHGRVREQRQQNTGLADWEQIRRVRAAVSIPVVSNGNILYHEDVEACLEATGCVGVMTAEGNLYNPFIFEPGFPLVSTVAREFMEMIEKYGAIASHVRGHLFKILRPAMNIHTEFRARVGNAHGLDEIMTEAKALLDLVDEDYRKAVEEGREIEGVLEKKAIPHWFCQPYVRPLPGSGHDKPTATKRPLPEHEAESVSTEPTHKEIKVES
jgi:tRNA-dihydrouridine synthase 1